tara:strand:- start:102 stop:551 length:450 start_codon:yes stop_codon:yes gene_type:complete
MVQATAEKLLEDIDTALIASGNFSSLTIYNVDLDEDEDTDFEFDVPNIIYGIEAIPTDYFMDGSRMMLTDVSFNVNVAEFDTINGLTRKRCVNYLMDKLQETIDDMTFSTVTPIEFSSAAGQQAAKAQVGEDEFVYRGSVSMNISYLDE